MTRTPSFVLTALLLGPSLAGADPLIAFGTSTVGQGDMHSWSEVSGSNLVGLNAADGVCKARASTANIPHSDQFVAWLSDRDNDAYCRLYGLAGKKSENCGEAALPVGAGPWVKVDQVPFARSLESALDSNTVYSQLDVDEFGNRFHTLASSWTATDIDGTFNTELENDGDCQLWTSSDQGIFGLPTLGSNLASGQDWTYDGSGASCDGHRRLMCLQKGNGSPLVGHSQFGHREAFVSSVDVSPNLGGTSGADATCQSLAANAGLYQPTKFKALLASYTEGVNATDRIVFDGPWYRVDGLLFAYNRAELIGGAVTLPLNVTEIGTYVGEAIALVGANNNGVALAQLDCNGWTDQSSGSATMGSLINQVAFAHSGGTRWLDVAQTFCTAVPPPQFWPRKLYCLSDADVLFHSEFETTRTPL